MNDKDKEQEIKESAEFYKNNGIKVHIVLLTRNFDNAPIKRFYNGTVKDILSSNLVIDDVKIGIKTVPIREIFILETFNEATPMKNGTT